MPVSLTKKHMKAALLCGMLGCLCYGGGDWLMMYGNPAYHGTLSWLTEGVAAIPQWRYDLAMALAFPGIILYGIALFAVEEYIKDARAFNGSEEDLKLFAGLLRKLHSLSSKGIAPFNTKERYLFYKKKRN